MKLKMGISAVAFLAASLLAADSSTRDDVKAAAKKLGDQANYSWNTTVVVPEGTQFKPGPSEGQAEKDGFTRLTMHFGDNTTDVFMKGGKLKEAIQQWDAAVHEWENGAPADLDHAELAKVQKKLETAKVRLAKESGKQKN